MSAEEAEELRHRIDVRVLEMLVCPITKTRLTLSADGSELISLVARLAFPIRNGVPMLCMEEAREVDLDELRRVPELQTIAPHG
jgi:uncharacterized protein YbaR (Trm112 family)